MYDLISGIIDHEWVSNYSGDQSYIYYVCGAIICIFFVVVIDFLYRIISAAIGRRR